MVILLSPPCKPQGTQPRVTGDAGRAVGAGETFLELEHGDPVGFEHRISTCPSLRPLLALPEAAGTERERNRQAVGAR